MNAIESREHKGYTIKIFQDECAENPFTSWDGEGKIVFHDRARHECNTDLSYDEAKRVKFAIPLSAYIHGGISLSVLGEGMRCQFDTSDYIAYWIPDQVNNPIKSRKGAIKAARQACELFNQWANGEVFGWEIEKDGVSFDSCWGYYGNEALEAAIITECHDLIEGYIKEAGQYSALV